MKETRFRTRRMNDVLKGIGDVSEGDFEVAAPDIQVDTPAVPSVLDVSYDPTLLPGTQYEGGTGLLDPETDQPIPYTEVIETDVPPADPIAAGIDPRALLKTAQGLYYTYKQVRNAYGQISYQAQQVPAPRAGAGTPGKINAKTILLGAALAFMFFG